MGKIWEETSSQNKIADQVNRFTVGDDYLLDQRLVPYDVKASKAHADGLQTAGILSGKEVQQLHKALDNVLQQWEAGAFTISPEQEDCHTAIEQFITEEAGETGKKIHTGRSRNDQVLVAMRLFEKDQLDKVTHNVQKLIATLLDQAEAYASVPMPGYTHTQKAMPSSVGMWLGALAEMLLLDLEDFRGVYRQVNRCPLGTAAGYGVNIDLPRQQVSDALGFAEPVTVSLTAQNTRGRIDLKLLQALDAVGSTLAHFASDLLLYTSREFDFFRFDESMYTGSSIMPQKRNLDPAELMRARSGNIGGAVQAVKLITHKMQSGYHRDYQPVKKHVMQSLDELSEMVEMSRLLTEQITPNEEKLREACTPELYAADRANELVKQGVSFREAYHKIKSEGKPVDEVDPVENITQKTHLGSTGNLGLERLREKADAFSLR